MNRFTNTRIKPNPFNTPKVVVDLKRADFLCCEIRAFVEDNHRSTSMDWSFFDSVEEQFLSKGTISPKQLDALENIYASINN